MATEADVPDFYTALNNALTETSQFEPLLDHPVFRDRLKGICCWIANSNDVADLANAVWLRLMKLKVSELPRFRTESQLFGWMAKLANNVYRDQQRHRLETMICSEREKHWPESSAEVPEKFIDEYMDHVDKCAYHAELMLLEQQEAEQELRSIFRLARGLDSQGHLLRGELLEKTIADHERRLAGWKKELQTTNHPFDHIALYNGDRQIASCGRFFDFSRHESINDLDPKAGLQIRGINNVENKDALLGSYALKGVRHEGVEQLLALDNGYTVGLKVIRLNERTFAIDFRCVETETLAELNPELEHTGNYDKSIHWPGEMGVSQRVSAIQLIQSQLHRTYHWLLCCVATLKITNWNWTSSFVKTWVTPSRPIQIGIILLAVGLICENSIYLNQWLTTKFTQQNTFTSFHALVSGRCPPKREGNSASNCAAPDRYRPMMRDPSDTEQKMVSTVKPLILAAGFEAVNAKQRPAKLVKYTSRVRGNTAATTCNDSVAAVRKQK